MVIRSDIHNFISATIWTADYHDCQDYSMIIKTIVMNIQTIVMAIKTIVMTIRTIVMINKTIVITIKL